MRDSDVEKYVDKYSNVPIEELKKLRAENYSDLWFEAKIKSLHERREWEKKYGRPALRTQPLAHVLSVSLQPKHKDNDDKPLVIYGHIYAEIHDSNRLVVHELYKRERDAPEILGTHGNLTLNGPEYSCWPDYACMPLFKNRINVELFDETDKVFATTCFDLDDTDVEDDYEQVKSIFIHCEKGSLNVQYVAIPFGVYCRIELRVCDRHDVEKHDIVNVNGKIVARYGKTYGNYSSEECLLFEKQNTEFERVEIDSAKRFHLSRCWVSLPAYSSLVVGLKLSEFETRRNIVNDTIELPIQGSGMTTGSILLDDIAIKVHVAWFSPELLGRRVANYDYHFPSSPLGIIKQGFSKEEVEVMDIERENESSDSEPNDVLSSSPKCPWSLHSHQSKPWSSPAIEIFSVIFCRERSKAVQIYGSIEVLSDDYDRICYIFKKDEHDALVLSENVKSTHIPDGSRVFDDCISLQMKFDIKDIENCLAIRGLVDWAASTLDTLSWHEKQLCSVVPGQHGGFVAIHYSVFSEAVYANIKVFLNTKTGCGDVYPKVWGSLIAQYSCYDYSSRYNKDYYRYVLFRRIQGDQVQVNDEMAIPLSRSTVVVPSYSDLIVNVDLSFGISDQKVSCAKNIKIGEGFKTVETNDYLIRIELDWCEIN